MINVIGTVKDKLIADLQPLDRNLQFTSTSDSAPQSLPTLNVNQLGNPTTAEDLEMSTENAIISTIELKAYSGKTLDKATALMGKASDSMLSMHYQRIYGIATLSDVSPYCVVARFRRTVGSGDILY